MYLQIYEKNPKVRYIYLGISLFLRICLFQLVVNLICNGFQPFV